MIRKCEYFQESEQIVVHNNVGMIPKRLFYQERDWTCSITCIRNILWYLEICESEDYYIETFNMKPGPYYSKDIKRLGILENHNTVYGCDLIDIDYDIKTIYELLSDNYYVMVESMICFDHWCNLLAYITNNSFDREKQYLLLYDPYYSQLKMISVDEFESVWLSGQHEKNNIFKDFIAIK